MQDFLNAAITGNLDYLKSKFFLNLFDISFVLIC